MTIGLILGSAFDAPPEGMQLVSRSYETPWGEARLHRVEELDREAWVLFRHARDHERLPHQIPYRAHAHALRAAGCESLLVTSSVGVLDDDLPLYEPLLVDDLVTLDNRLPDGSACTMFETSSADQGHLVLDEGLFDDALNAQLRQFADEVGHPIAGTATFGYVGGPRGKTKAENRMWGQLGAGVNSMTLAPEVVLANELEIPCAGVVVGHKYSTPDETAMEDTDAVETSLKSSREPLARIATAFLEEGSPVPFGNQIYRFDDDT